MRVAQLHRRQWKYLFILGLFSLAAHAQVEAPRLPFIRLIVPDADSSVTAFPSYRLSASTTPGSTVTLNGNPMRVYLSGAFAGLLDLRIGNNMFTITARDPSGPMRTRSFAITRIPPASSTSPDSLVLEDALMEPQVDAWLRDHEQLTVQCKGTPGCTATFLEGFPMREAAPAEANGLRGVYRGVYSVRANASLRNANISFRLADSLGHSVTKTSSGRVTCIEERLPLVAVTKGLRPYLNLGHGDARLNGATLFFLNPGVRLAVTGKAGSDYRVALTPYQEAWIPEEMTDLQPAGSSLPFSPTGPIIVFGDEKLDYVTIGLADKLPYSSFQLLNPTRIVVDIFGAVCDSNGDVLNPATNEIKTVTYQQIGKNRFRLTIELRHKQLWGYDLAYRGRSFVVKVKRPPARLQLRSLLVALDAGHGGSNDGAIGATGAKEKEINLATTLYLCNLLIKRGARVTLTRDGDSTMSNNERLRKALDAGADILISLHSNSVGLNTDPEAIKGASTYYKHPGFRLLSQCILRDVLKTSLSSFGNLGGFNFMLNSPTELPTALVELGFISNPEDEMRLLDDKFRRKLAQRIVDGIEDFLDECEE